MGPPRPEQAIKDLFDSAVSNRVAPGFQYVVFDRDRFLIDSVSGVSRLAIPNVEDKQQPPAPALPAKGDDVHAIASAGKIASSILALIVLDKGLGKNGMTLADLDDHEKLVEILPEFKLGSTRAHTSDHSSLLTKVLEGFEDGVGSDGKKIMTLRNCKTPITLRMLMTHSAGLAYPVSRPRCLESLQVVG